MTLDANALSRLKVKDLQLELKKRGLDTSGLKTTLVQRLQEHLQQEESPVTQEVEEVDKSIEKTSENHEQKSGSETKENTTKEDPVSEKEGETMEKRDEDKTIKRKAHDEEEMATKKQKLSQDVKSSKDEEKEEEKEEQTTISDNNAEAGEKKGEESTTQENETIKTIRIDNFVRPFTLNAVKTLVQEFGPFVENGFWMDAIKTHCFVTYSSPEIAIKTSSALDGKVWPPENGRSLSVKLVDCTAMEVSQYGEENIPSRPKSNTSSSTPAPLRPKVTIDEFFHKTEAKPVLYYLPLTEEQIKQKKERQGQQKQEGQQPRKRRHRGGRKRNRRNRLQRR